MPDGLPTIGGEEQQIDSAVAMLAVTVRLEALAARLECPADHEAAALRSALAVKEHELHLADKQIADHQTAIDELIDRLNAAEAALEAIRSAVGAGSAG